MGSPPIPDRRSPVASSSSSTTTTTAAPAARPIGFGDAPPRPHPGIRPAVAPASVPFSPPKRRTGGSIKGKERALSVEEGEAAEQGTASGDSAFPPQMQPTYRHILGSGNGGAANPLRVIAHIDIDAAYAAMEMARLRIPADQPMAVQQWNGLIAVNYPARAYGITRHETPAEALKKCPDLMLVHVQTYKNGETVPGYWDGAKPETHKVSLDMYRKESKKILAVFQEFCPLVEKASIDESFLDLTLPVRERLLAAYPALATPPPAHNLDTSLPPPSALGITRDDIKWSELGNVVPISGQKREKVRRLDPTGVPMPSSFSPAKASQAAVSDEVAPIEEEQASTSTSASPEPLDDDLPLTWSDICLSLGAAIVRDTRAAVTERLGYTCSAGIATNKMLAKLTSAWKKPNAQTILRYGAIPAFLRPMPFQKIRNLGGKLGTAVKETYEANTVGDLLDYPLPELRLRLGDASGMWLWEMVRGLDYAEGWEDAFKVLEQHLTDEGGLSLPAVDPKTAVKSMLSSKNFRPYINKYGEVMHWMGILATELHLRLNDAREETPGLWPKTITFTHRSPSFVIRSHQAPFPFTSNLTRTYILNAGEKLFRTAIGAGQATERITDRTTVGPYSNLQLSFSGLGQLEQGQRGIEGFFVSAPATSGSTTATNGARQRVKSESVAPKAEEDMDDTTPASSKKRGASFFGPSTFKDDAKPTINTCKQKKRDPPVLVKSIGANANGTEELILASSSDEDEERDSAWNKSGLPRFRCPRCSKVLTVPEEVRRAIEGGEMQDDKADEVLEREKAEHADWHVARDLLEAERRAGGWTTSSNARSGTSGSDRGSKKRKSSTTAGASAPKKSKKQGGGGGGGKAADGKGLKSRGTLNGFVSRG